MFSSAALGRKSNKVDRNLTPMKNVQVPESSTSKSTYQRTSTLKESSAAPLFLTSKYDSFVKNLYKAPRNPTPPQASFVNYNSKLTGQLVLAADNHQQYLGWYHPAENVDYKTPEEEAGCNCENCMLGIAMY